MPFLDLLAVQFHVTSGDANDSLEGGLSFLAGALREPLFLEEELKREKEVVLGEYDRNEAQPGFDFNQKSS